MSMRRVAHTLLIILIVVRASPVTAEDNTANATGGCIVLVQGNGNRVDVSQGCGSPIDQSQRNPFKRVSLFIHFFDDDYDQHVALRIAKYIGPYFAFVQLRAVATVPNDYQIRYFHQYDRAPAKRLRDILNGTRNPKLFSVEDFTTYQPPPRPGLLEIWIPDISSQ